MPSAALADFEKKMLVDVYRIIKSHAELSQGRRGRHGLGHLTRGGVLLLCAAWELYLEELLIEAVEECISRVSGPGDLPELVQRTIAESVRTSKHELRPLEMSGDGWKTVYREIAQSWVQGLNSPKKRNVDVMFSKLIGVAAISNAWSSGNSLDEFVAARGDIAHRGADAGTLTVPDKFNCPRQLKAGQRCG